MLPAAKEQNHRKRPWAAAEGAASGSGSLLLLLERVVEGDHGRREWQRARSSAEDQHPCVAAVRLDGRDRGLSVFLSIKVMHEVDEARDLRACHRVEERGSNGRGPDGIPAGQADPTQQTRVKDWDVRVDAKEDAGFMCIRGKAAGLQAPSANKTRHLRTRT